MNKHFFFLLVLISVFSCKTPKTVYKNVYHTDTIVSKEIIKVTQPRLTNLVVDEPCDSLGRLKPIFYETKTPTKTLSIKNIDNKLVIEEKQDSIIEINKEEKKISISETDEVKVITKAPKWIWYSIILNILLLGWTFRKFIRIPI